MDNKKLIPIAASVLVLLALGVGFWFWSKKRQTSFAPHLQTKGTQAPTLGDTIFEKTQSNPLKGKVPEINPFKEQKNPFDTIYKNPFKK